MKIVILAAGKGTRFHTHIPKPLIKFGGKTMLEWVYEDVGGYQYPEDIIVVTQKVFNISGNFKKIELDHYTNGPACTAIESLSLINLDEELIILNCDQRILDFNPYKISQFATINNYSAVIGVYNSLKEHNSYINLDKDYLVSHVKEKRVISNISTNGVHYWKKSSLFKDSYFSMVKRNDKVNNEFYISHSFNYLIDLNYRVGAYHFNLHFPIGIPEDLDNFIKLGV